jgi:hypothetical protein
MAGTAVAWRNVQITGVPVCCDEESRLSIDYEEQLRCAVELFLSAVVVNIVSNPNTATVAANLIGNRIDC